MGKKPQTALSLEAFKMKVQTDDAFRSSFKRRDLIDFDNGLATLYRENLMSELERFECKNEEDLLDSLWHTYGVFAKVVD